MPTTFMYTKLSFMLVFSNLENICEWIVPRKKSISNVEALQKKKDKNKQINLGKGGRQLANIRMDY